MELSLSANNEYNLKQILPDRFSVAVEFAQAYCLEVEKTLTGLLLKWIRDKIDLSETYYPKNTKIETSRK